MKRTFTITATLCLAAAVLPYGAPLAQASPSYRLEPWVLNAGGHPSDGQVLESPGFRMSLDAIGEGVLGPGLASTSYAIDTGYGRSLPPPAEVSGVVAHPDKITFAWNPDLSVGEYLIYRGGLDLLSGVSGSCLLSNLPSHSASLDEFPATSQGFYYLVIARNRLGEDGSPGRGSGGAPRTIPVPCP